MIGLLSFLISFTGIVLCVALVVSVMDKSGKWSGIFSTISLFAAKVCAILLALFVAVTVADHTSGILAFGTIGIYVACASIIWASVKDLMGNSTLLSNISTIATHKAASLQTQMSAKAEQIAAEAKAKAEKKD
jgi:hypothetical protein